MAGDPSKLKKFQEFGRSEILFRMVRQPDSSRMLVAASDFKIYDLDPLEKDAETKEWQGHSSYVTGLKQVGDQVLSASYDGKLIWWNKADGKPVRTVDAHTKWIRHLDVSADGKLAASVADDMVCRLWDTKSGKLLHELRGHDAVTESHFPSMLYAVAFSPDGKHVATGDRVGKVVVWGTATGKQETVLETPVMYTWDATARIHSIGGIRSLAFSPDGAHLAVGGMGKVGNIDHLGGPSRVELFDWKKGERKFEISEDGNKGLVEKIVFHPKGEWLLAAGGDSAGFLQFFDMDKGKAIKQEKSPMHVYDLDFTPDHSRMYTVGHHKICIWDL
ncbi:WD40 repeat domain-containing protein [Lignipirellula cremea]|uniref:WD domain, G-beta repeat n=1 Tax=Lignipirellula cremea TaxID=2528010 RepID=A0A518DUM2_9BACT|nr:PQQ-binding-like beta-propeller repeat protein [Lignipirellula cremea]QDU95535.1 WD domain, G-beta repeat [Lignipirellula cremea]